MDDDDDGGGGWLSGREGEGGVLFERAGSFGTLALPLAHNYIIVD